MKIKNQPKTSKIVIITLTCLLVLSAIGYGMYASTSGLWPFQNTPDKQQAETITSEQSPNNTSANSEDNEERVKNGGGAGQDQSPTAGSGVTDNRGEGVEKGQSGTISTSGNITLYTPKEGQKLINGATITGVSKVPIVYYRINDNINGMISNGQLRVKDGKFSGTISIATNASQGTFEVYSFNSQGQEINNISIKVTY